MTPKVELTRYFDPSTHGALVPSQESSAFSWEAAVRILRKNRWLGLGLAAGLTLATGVFASMHSHSNSAAASPTLELRWSMVESGTRSSSE